MTAAIADVEYMLNNLDELNVIYLENQVNKQLILLMGHSFGGNVAHTLGFTDQRIKAIIDIDSKITEKEIYGRIGVPPNPEGKPVLFIRAILQYQESVGDQLTKIQNAYILNYNVQHSAFKDISYLARKIMKLNQQGLMSRVWDWFFKKGPIFEPVDTDIGEKDIEEWFIEFKKDIIDWMKSIHQKR